MAVKKIIDPKFQGGIHFNDKSTISWNTSDDGFMTVYHIDTRYGLSSREITLYNLTGALGDDDWNGSVIEFGEWRDLEWYEIEQCKEFLKERGYL